MHSSGLTARHYDGFHVGIRDTVHGNIFRVGFGERRTALSNKSRESTIDCASNNHKTAGILGCSTRPSRKGLPRSSYPGGKRGEKTIPQRGFGEATPHYATLSG